MKTLMEFYRFVLREEEEAPADAEFGQYAFAPTRKELPDPKEPNTKEEESAKQAIYDYLVSNQKGGLDVYGPKLVQLVNQGYYEKVLSPKDYSTAWRILEMQPDVLAEIFGIEEDELEVEGEMGPGILKPHGGNISGWTVRPSFLIKSMPNYGTGNAVAIFAADIASNKFFGNPGKMSNAVDVHEMDAEMETIAVGPVRYTKCAYAVIPYHDTVNRYEYLANALNKVAS